ncbi:hypothetical protein [Gemmatimonas phototrophica]|uniref:Uncharacterized protein n=1 Tax=Gemmatimonas phototrophica TaxID=1379270 RepID=A0A143BIY1_9BACT|nr:hypothetical protein [Gemmatimonas phototrophica]AMW04430.1 hypothetical protein GEMMAAP_05405 [Gemmatimonas phototrophica]
MTVPVQTVPDEQAVETSAEIPAAEPVAAPVAQAPAVPDRADSPVTEVAERFLRAVIAQVPLERIEELHLFSPLRQGTVETGIAVLAARVPVVVVEPVDDVVLEEPTQQLSLSEPAAEVVADDVAVDDPAVGDIVVADSEVDEAVVVEAIADDTDASLADDEVAPMGDAVIVVEEIIAAEGDDDEDVSYADAEPVELSAEEGDEAVAVEEEIADIMPAQKARPVRHTVYTARYRYVIKGPERGKWESSIKAEAEAPLITVETVVRGVQRRAGEDSEIVRYSAAQIARALRLPFPA